ncbi:MAG: response regulator [Dehalococcoidia bacterium]
MGERHIDYSEIVRAVICSLNIDEVLKRLSELVKRQINYDWMRVCLYRQHEDQLQVRFIVYDTCPVFSSEATLPLHDSLPGQTILTGRPIVRNDISQEGTHPDECLLPKETSLRSMLAVMLTSRGQSIGTLDLGRREPGRFAEDEVKLAQDIASHIGVLVEHAWLVEESNELAKIEERNRLAREIHDTVIQSLISIVLQLELAERRLQSDVRAARLEIKRACELARQCLEDGRRSLLNLKPLTMERSSVSEAVAREVKTLEAAGFEARFSPEGSPLPLPGEAEIALYRIAQEAIANIRKHARASKVTATLRFGPEAVMLSISDNGIGFDPAVVSEKGPDKGHFGLTGARERALLAGGDLRVESAPDQGTTVTAQIPITKTVAVETARQEVGFPAQDSRIRILLVDDHAVFRQGLRQILEQLPDIEVIGEAAEGGEALGKVQSLRPDVAVVDVQLPGMSGIEVVADLASQGSGTRSLILSAHRDGDLVLQAIRAGARAYLLKDIAGSALADAIRAVHRGEMFLHPAVSSDFATRVGGLNDEDTRESLTAREADVLRLIARGLRNKEIARQLSLTEATVKYHVAHLLQKLGVDSRTEALVKAQKLGLLTREYTAS